MIKIDENLTHNEKSEEDNAFFTKEHLVTRSYHTKKLYLISAEIRDSVNGQYILFRFLTKDGLPIRGNKWGITNNTELQRALLHLNRTPVIADFYVTPYMGQYTLTIDEIISDSGTQSEEYFQKTPEAEEAQNQIERFLDYFNVAPSCPNSFKMSVERICNGKVGALNIVLSRLINRVQGISEKEASEILQEVIAHIIPSLFLQLRAESRNGFLQKKYILKQAMSLQASSERISAISMEVYLAIFKISPAENIYAALLTTMYNNVLEEFEMEQLLYIENIGTTIYEKGQKYVLY